jgi:hypothetical protein
MIKNSAGEEILRRLTPLSGLQEAILQRLGLGTALYRQLEIQAITRCATFTGEGLDRHNSLM